MICSQNWETDLLLTVFECARMLDFAEQVESTHRPWRHDHDQDETRLSAFAFSTSACFRTAIMHAVKEVNGVPTELLIQKYEDRILVLVTQVGKVGCLVRLSIVSNSAVSNSYPSRLKSRSLNPLL